MHKFKMVTAAILAFLVLIVLLQNSAPTETNFLFWTLTMPRAVLLFFATAIGFLLGVLAVLMIGRRRPPL